jgi:hypothetical protein
MSKSQAFPLVQNPKSGIGHLFVEVYSSHTLGHTHTHTHTHTHARAPTN